MDSAIENRDSGTVAEQSAAMSPERAFAGAGLRANLASSPDY